MSVGNDCFLSGINEYDCGDYTEEKGVGNCIFNIVWIVGSILGF